MTNPTYFQFKCKSCNHVFKATAHNGGTNATWNEKQANFVVHCSNCFSTEVEHCNE